MIYDDLPLEIGICFQLCWFTRGYIIGVNITTRDLGCLQGSQWPPIPLLATNNDKPAYCWSLIHISSDECRVKCLHEDKPAWIIWIIVVSTPLKNMSQLGWWNSQLNGKIKSHVPQPPTRYPMKSLSIETRGIHHFETWQTWYIYWWIPHEYPDMSQNIYLDKS